jgi:hypothetical protein
LKNNTKTGRRGIGDWPIDYAWVGFWSTLTEFPRHLETVLPGEPGHFYIAMSSSTVSTDLLSFSGTMSRQKIVIGRFTCLHRGSGIQHVSTVLPRSVVVRSSSFSFLQDITEVINVYERY